MFKKKENPMLIWYYKPSVILTYLGVISATIGIYFAINGRIDISLICLIVSGVCDAFDGKVARACKRSSDEKAFGIQLDSLADMVSFIFLPIMICYGLGLMKWYNIVIYAIYTLGGIIRLAYFNVKAECCEGPVSYYSGLSVTSVSIIFPITFIISYFTSRPEFNVLYTLVMLFTAILFVLNFKIKKPSGKLIYIFVVFALIISAIIFMLSVR